TSREGRCQPRSGRAVRHRRGGGTETTLKLNLSIPKWSSLRFVSVMLLKAALSVKPKMISARLAFLDGQWGAYGGWGGKPSSSLHLRCYLRPCCGAGGCGIGMTPESKLLSGVSSLIT